MYGFVLNVYGYPRFQYSFPTRRSSDLTKLGLTSDGVMRTRGSTTPHRVDGRRNQQGGWGLVSTDDAHSSELTRRNIGTCAFRAGSYIVPTRLGGEGWDLVFQSRLQDGSGRKFRGGRRRKQGLRRLVIREQALRLG